MASDHDPEEGDFFLAFASLRERSVEALEGFEERLRRRLDDADHQRKASLRDVFASALAELLNLGAAMLGGDASHKAHLDPDQTPEETNGD